MSRNIFANDIMTKICDGRNIRTYSGRVLAKMGFFKKILGVKKALNTLVDEKRIPDFATMLVQVHTVLLIGRVGRIYLSTALHGIA